MNFDDDFGTDLYIDDVDEAYEVAYGDGSNTLVMKHMEKY